MTPIPDQKHAEIKTLRACLALMAHGEIPTNSDCAESARLLIIMILRKEKSLKAQEGAGGK